MSKTMTTATISEQIMIDENVKKNSQFTLIFPSNVPHA